MNDKIKSVITCDLDGKIESLSEGRSKIGRIQKFIYKGIIYE